MQPPGDCEGAMKLSVLFLLHLPPPVHGSSVVGGLIKDSKLINRTFCCRYVNLLASREVGESGHPSIGKAYGFVLLIIRLARELMRKMPDACYFALTTTGWAFFRDVILIAMLKPVSYTQLDVYKRQTWYSAMGSPLASRKLAGSVPVMRRHSETMSMSAPMQ